MVNRRRNRRNSGAAPRRIRKLIGKMELGTKFTPSVDPPEVTTAPWNAVTLVWKANKSFSISYKDCYKKLLSILGLKTWTKPDDKVNEDPVTFRIETVRVWGLDKQAINVSVFELIGGGPDRIKQLADYGSGINFSRIGWRWGANARIDPGSADASTSIVECATTGNVLLYLQVLWCVHTATAVTLKSVDTDFEHLEIME